MLRLYRVQEHAFCKNFTKLYTFLIKTVNIPYKSLEHNLVLEVGKQCTECLRINLLSDNNRRWASTLEILVAVFIFLAACKCNNLCCNIRTKLLLACAVLNDNICVKLVILKSNKLQWYNIGSLMQ